MSRKKVDVNLLGVGDLLKGVSYLLFPAKAGIDLVSELIEEGAEADIRRKRESRQHPKEKEDE